MLLLECQVRTDSKIFWFICTFLSISAVKSHSFGGLRPNSEIRKFESLGLFIVSPLYAVLR